MKCKDRKILSKFISTILIIVLVFHLLWYINYSKFPKVSGYEQGVKNYYKEFEEYIISYHPPQYPSFTGNYAISDYEEDVQIIFWPKTLMKKESEIGVILHNKENNTSYLFYVDDQFRYLADKSTLDEPEEEIALKLLENNESKLKEYMTVLLEEIESK